MQRIATLVDGRRFDAIDRMDTAAPPTVPAEGTQAGPSGPARWTIEVLGLLAVGVAHDFRNLLTVILGHASLLAEHIDSASPARELLHNIDVAAHRASELANQVLTFARRKTAGEQLVLINDVLEETVRFLRLALGRTIELTLAPDPSNPSVRADSGQLTQMLMNLCLNARDAMPRGGRITVSTMAINLTASDLPAHPGSRPGRFVRMRVADTGVGIAPEVRQRLFELFFTSKPPERGSGVGLATVQRIAQQYCGWIECISEPGCGACFDVYLPQA